MTLSDFKRKIEHAFKIDDGRDSITDEDNQLLEKISNFLIKKRMTVPALMFLETVKPLNFVGSSMMTFFKPTLGAVLNKFEYERLESLLEKRCGIEILIEKIDELQRNIKK